MKSPLVWQDIPAIEQSLALGLKKTALPKLALLNENEPSDQTLAIIALAAERTQYADGNVRQHLTSEVLAPPQDERPPLPDDIRHLLLRLASDASSVNAVWEAFCRLIHAGIGQSGFRLHPFDLMKLQKYLSVVEVSPASYESWYLQQLNATGQTMLQTDDITWDIWQQFSKKEQLRFLRHQRRIDPDEARHMIEQDFSAAPAASRQIYVEALAEGLSRNDMVFLESLLGDRSTKVVEIAKNYLARFPETAAAAAYRDEVKVRINVQFLTGKIGLAQQKGKKASQTLAEFQALIEYLPIEVIAQAADVQPEQLPKRVADELILPLARSAASSGRFPLAIEFMQKDSESTLLPYLSVISNWFSAAPDPDRMLAADLLVKALCNNDTLLAATLLELHRMLRRPLSEAIAERLLKAKAFSKTLEQTASDNRYQASAAIETVAMLAVLMPVALQPVYLEKVSAISFPGHMNPVNFLALIKLLQTKSPH